MTKVAGPADRQREVGELRRPAWWALLHWTVAGCMPMMTFLAARRPLVAAAFALTGLVMVVGGSFVRALENRSAWFLVAGTGLPWLYLAWWQRGGPGTVCETTTYGSGCHTVGDPRPMIATFFGAVAISVAGYLWSGRRARRRGRPQPQAAIT